MRRAGPDDARGEEAELCRRFRGLRSALRSLYAAKVEIAKRSGLPQDRLATLRALAADHSAALRALSLRRDAERKALRDRREAEHFAAAELTRRKRAEAQPIEGPR